MVIQNVGFNMGGGGICSLVLFVGLFATSVSAIPVQMSDVGTVGSVKYPIHVACECMFTLYVDGKYVAEGNKANYVPYGLITEWNDTKKYYPVIYENEPKIVAFHGVGGQYPAFLNGFIMEMNEGKSYTKHGEWRCKDFSKTANKVAPENWFADDYDDSSWEMAASYGANYQNNSFQIFENPRDSINLNAEWLWTKDNTVANVYCRKKNGNIGTIPVSKTIHTTPVQTSAPSSVSKSIHTTPVQTSAPHRVQTSAPHRVQTSAPHRVQTSAPPTTVSKTIHTTPVQTSAPSSVSKTIHTTPVQTSAPHPVQTSAPHPVPTIVISPHIQIIIQNIKYSQRRSNAHLDNLLRRIKLYNDEYKLYKQLTLARLHLRRHYNGLFYDIKRVLEKHDTDDTDDTHDKSYNKKTVKNIPHFIRSMHTLNASIKKIEQSIQFIKGNHKYILLKILNKLKIQYQEDTQKMFEIIENI
jgi:hypothetical protein